MENKQEKEGTLNCKQRTQPHAGNCDHRRWPQHHSISGEATRVGAGIRRAMGGWGCTPSGSSSGMHTVPWEPAAQSQAPPPATGVQHVALGHRTVCRQGTGDSGSELSQCTEEQPLLQRTAPSSLHPSCALTEKQETPAAKILRITKCLQKVTSGKRK